MTRARTGLAASALTLLAVAVGCSADHPGAPAEPPAPAVAAAGACLVRSTPAGSQPAGTAPSATEIAGRGATRAGTAPPATGIAGRGVTPSGARAGAGRPLPDLALPCLDGSGTVSLGELAKPAVVNLWASWCSPCQAELPAFQRYARRAAGLVTVVGVDTADTREGAASIVERLELTFPNLYDPRSQLRNALGNRPLPVTLFVAPDGTIAHLYNAKALDDATLDRLVQQHLGVVVPG